MFVCSRRSALLCFPLTSKKKLERPVGKWTGQLNSCSKLLTCPNWLSTLTSASTSIKPNWRLLILLLLRPLPLPLPFRDRQPDYSARSSDHFASSSFWLWLEQCSAITWHDSAFRCSLFAIRLLPSAWKLEAKNWKRNLLARLWTLSREGESLWAQIRLGLCGFEPRLEAARRQPFGQLRATFIIWLVRGQISQASRQRCISE